MTSFTVKISKIKYFFCTINIRKTTIFINFPAHIKNHFIKIIFNISTIVIKKLFYIRSNTFISIINNLLHNLNTSFIMFIFHMFRNILLFIQKTIIIIFYRCFSISNHFLLKIRINIAIIIPKRKNILFSSFRSFSSINLSNIMLHHNIVKLLKFSTFKKFRNKNKFSIFNLTSIMSSCSSIKMFIKVKVLLNLNTSINIC